jgi:cell division protein FtsA
MEGLSKEFKEEVVLEEVQEDAGSEHEEIPKVQEEKPRPVKKRPFFEKFIESLKDFLDNAE